MKTNIILVIGFFAVLFLLWQILKELIDINLRSGQTSEHLFEIESEIKSETGNKTDLRRSKLVDLSDIADHLKEINNKLESIESSVDAINDKE